jgi:hypothetical protein
LTFAVGVFRLSGDEGSQRMPKRYRIEMTLTNEETNKKPRSKEIKLEFENDAEAEADFDLKFEAAKKTGKQGTTSNG